MLEHSMPGILDETVLTLSQAARRLPKLGKNHVSPTTVWRWCRKGIRGVHLEYACVGRRIVTSREAMTRFAGALAEADRPLNQPEPEIASTAHKFRMETLERLCRALGL